MTPTRQAVKRLLSRVLPPQQFLLHGDPRRVATTSGREAVPISLTFDDGPDPVWTPPVLEALDEANWKGTFFLIGRKAEQHPELVREIVARGHEIGNHSYAHREPDEVGVEEFIDGVVQTQEILSSMTGQEVGMMRPPKGRLDVRKTRALWRLRQSIVLWNVDPRDYQMASVETARSWAREYQPAGGDVVLLHDNVPYGNEIVRTLIAERREAVEPVHVSHWLAPAPPGVQDRAKQLIGSLVAT